MQAQAAPRQGAARGTWMGILLTGGFPTAAIPELAFSRHLGVLVGFYMSNFSSLISKVTCRE